MGIRNTSNAHDPRPQPPTGFVEMMPHNDDAEHAILGSLMLDARCWHALNAIIDVEDLYRESSRYVWRACAALIERHEPIDIITLCDELHARGILDKVGGPSYIARLNNEVPSVANVEYYARLVKDAATRRKIAAEADRLRQIALNLGTPVEQVIHSAQTEMAKIVLAANQTQSLTLNDGVIEWQEEFTARMMGERAPALTTGIPDLDDAFTGGLQRNRAILFAGYQKSGKSKGALQIAAHVARTHGAHVIHYSTEMTRADLLTRLISHEARHEEHELQRPPVVVGKSEKAYDMVRRVQDAVFRGATALQAYGDRWHLYTHPKPKLSDIIATTHAMRAQVGPDVPIVLVIDYVQEIDAGVQPGRPESRRLNAEAAAPVLVAMCNELNVLGILVAHLNRPDKKTAKLTPPHQDDVYGSAAWAKAVDHSIIIWQPLADDTGTSTQARRAQQYTQWRVGRSRHNQPRDVELRADHGRNFVEPWIGPAPELKLSSPTGAQANTGGAQDSYRDRSY